MQRIVVTPALSNTYWMKVLQWNTQDVDGSTSLMIASSLGHSEVVRVLINYGADVNILAKGPNATALMFACNYQRTVCVDLLLAGGADPNLCGRDYHLSLLPALLVMINQWILPSLTNSCQLVPIPTHRLQRWLHSSYERSRLWL